MAFRLLISALLGIGAIAAVVAKMSKKLLYPVANPRVTSPFGWRIHPITKLRQFHNGIDLAGVSGQAIAAPADGVVTGVNNTTSGGNQLFIRHDNGFTSGYAHLQRSVVAAGDRVKASQVIAYMGSTGESTGPHLHFTLRDSSGEFVNPVDYLS